MRVVALLYKICPLAALLYIILSFIRHSPCSHPTLRSGYSGWKSSDYGWKTEDLLRMTQNKTLGFEKVFTISLPSRTDKRDAIVLGSSVTDFTVDWVDGVYPDDIEDKAYPSTWNKDARKPGEIGCWRGHMNAMQRIIAERITSALVFEDDADWDVTLKSQLLGFALGARTIQNDSHPLISPYGDHWDLLWIGHCGVKYRDDEKRFYVIHDDITVVPSHHRPKYYYSPYFDIDDNTRLISQAEFGVCLTGYAVTFNGARKILAALSMSPLDEVVDLAYGGLCQTGYLSCIAPYPSIIGNWRPAGLAKKDSDIHNEPEVWHDASSHGIAYSTMLNINRLLNNEATVISEWEDALVPELDLKQVKVAEGSLVVV